MLRKCVVLAGVFTAGLVSTASGYPFAPTVQQEGGLPWWVWLLVILVLLAFVALIIWWARRRPAEPAPVPETRAAAPVAPQPVQPDNLERIEGIGPRIAAVLRDAGIVTFAQLATTDVSRLQEILTAANLRLADPATWPEQARLAANGDWAAFDALASQLKGGRRA